MSIKLLLLVAITGCHPASNSSNRESAESVEETIQEVPVSDAPAEPTIDGFIALFRSEQNQEVPKIFSQKYLNGQDYITRNAISKEGPLLSVVVSQTYATESYDVYTFTNDGIQVDSKTILFSEGGDIYHYKFEVLSDRSFVLHGILDLSLYEDTTDGPMPDEEKARLIELGNIENYYIIDPNGMIQEFALFGLGKWSQDDPASNFKLFFAGKLSGFDLICFLRKLECTPVQCDEKFDFFLMSNGSVVHKKSVTTNTEGSPEIALMFDTFVQYVETKHVWSENEAGAMEFDEKDNYVDGIRLVVKDGQLIQPKELDKVDLRVFRNLIFAKYGYKFKSEDLNAFFSTKTWYRPKHDNVDALLTYYDKELIAYLKDLEERD